MTHPDPGLKARLLAAIRDVPDFPKPGIVFKDITPVLADPALFGATIDALAAPFVGRGVTHVAAIESRGFLLGAPVARVLKAGLIPMRKAGKLPWTTQRESYDLEYGTDALEVHADAFSNAARVLIVDDVLATGGTAAAAARLTRRCGAHVEGFAFLMTLGFLEGRARLDMAPVESLLDY
ncbi:MAG: adenine phosphoribosyltransferase [Gemmatimonadaceae bacterium]|nr:adenine phosphoribosyltransferase [Gemmatimonadaceae bacterium]NUQ91926.1 adenine phosphoribosyltransferase [Gemmatimonadaceae bacterium]NUR19930.1 adenine phosphoribosyltransferase [Gemmatimonadaceae bacterium]